ncbi:MAG: hypothetical protein ACJAU6_000727 [Alphaproteobacteria bacterium]
MSDKTVNVLKKHHLQPFNNKDGGAFPPLILNIFVLVSIIRVMVNDIRQEPARRLDHGMA